MRLRHALMLCLSIAALAACQKEDAATTAEPSAEASEPADPAADAMPVQEPAPDALAHFPWTLPEDATRVDARTNIYLAGLAAAPANDPGQGQLPVAIDVGQATTIQFPTIEGLLGCAGGQPGDGPDGGQCVSATTNISAMNGYSASKSTNRSLFLVGVFPVAPNPETAVEAGIAPETDTESRVSPLANQVFLIGDGKTADGQLQTFVKPEGATTLYLGFADGFGFSGAPGAYDDNTGYLRVSATLDPQ
jgi:hypothetical protein